VQLTTADQGNVDSVAHYKMDPALVLGRMSNEKRQEFLYQVQLANPKWNPANYKPMQLALSQITSGLPTAPGGQLRSFGTIMGHTQLIRELADALNNKAAPKIVNRIKNEIADQMNQPGPVDLTTAVTIWGPEMLKAIGTGQSDVELQKKLQELISMSRSPKVIHSQIDKVLMPMLSSKVGNLMTGFYSSLPDEMAQGDYKGYAERKLSKEARGLIMRSGMLPDYQWDQGDLGDDYTHGTIIRPSGSTPSAPAAPKVSDEVKKRAGSYLPPVGG
jgi:hypothetical protein